MSEQRRSNDEPGRVVPFRRSRDPHGPRMPHWAAPPYAPPVDDTGKYERSGPDDDDYRHRMRMNLLAFAACVLLGFIGVWLANQIAEMRKNQDCVLSGRPGCTKVEVPGRPR